MPDFTLPWQETAAAWLVTYLLHSTLLLGSVWLLTRLRLLTSNELRETLWKAALTGGMLTATVQAWSGYQPLSGSFDLLAALNSDLSARLDHVKLDAEDGSGSGLPSFSRLPKSAPGAVGESSGQSAPSLKWHSTGAPLVFHLRTPGPSAQGTIRLPSQESPQVESWSYRRESRLHAFGPLTVTPQDSASTGNFTFKLRPLSNPWVRGALWIWLVIGSMLALRVLITKARLGRLLAARTPIHQGPLRGMLDDLCRRADASYVLLTRSDFIASPLAVGREICIPARAERELCPRQQQGMLAHELAHIVRRDSFWLFFSALIQAFFFIQPLNRLARRRLCRESEYLCDDWAVRQVGEGRSLARCLAEVAAWIEASPAPALAPGMAGRESAIVSRVRRLVGETPPPRRTGLWSRLAAGFLLLLLVAGLAPAVSASSPVNVLFQGFSDKNPRMRHFFIKMDREKDGKAHIKIGPQDSSNQVSPKAKKRYFL
ncbi:MAG TPA: M56 family metallopeptidase [Acidobacteriota bacterium]|nr:M56 family metallopeptidase [Acidobacteriota bacterium]